VTDSTKGRIYPKGRLNFGIIIAMYWVTRILSITLLTFFLGTMFFGLFHMSMGMDMSEGMSDCPFMSHEEVICPMNLADHIGAWKSVFLSVAPTLTLLLAVAGIAVFVVSVAPNLLRMTQYASPLLHRYLRTRTYTFSYRPLQELFSNGILHPKLY
jgi:hypothetical protein